MLELEAGRARFFNGTWHAWRKEQAARELALGRAIEKQQAEIARMERFVERFRYKATKARQAQERLKKLDKIERIERDPRDGRGARVRVQEARALGPRDLRARGRRGWRSAPTRRASCSPTPSCGSSAASTSRSSGPTAPARRRSSRRSSGERPLDGGRLRSGHNVKVGYLSQHAEELEGGGARTVLEAAVKRTGLPPNQARALLGRFLFSGEEAEKPLDGLSGGERRRLSLAILVAGGANVLILDEPTNHLDLESREALEDALRLVPGLAAARVPRPRAARRRRLAHRRRRGLHAALLRRRLARVRPGARGAQGAGPAARARRRRRSTNGDARAPKEPARQGRPARPKPAGPSKNRVREQARLERAVEEAEAALAVARGGAGRPRRWATKYESAKSTARHTAAKRAVEEAYAALEAFEAKV